METIIGENIFNFLKPYVIGTSYNVFQSQCQLLHIPQQLPVLEIRCLRGMAVNYHSYRDQSYFITKASDFFDYFYFTLDRSTYLLVSISSCLLSSAINLKAAAAKLSSLIDGISVLFDSSM